MLKDKNGICSLKHIVVQSKDEEVSQEEYQ